jgi:hypothetical protein
MPATGPTGCAGGFLVHCRAGAADHHAERNPNAMRNAFLVLAAALTLSASSGCGLIAHCCGHHNDCCDCEDHGCSYCGPHCGACGCSDGGCGCDHCGTPGGYGHDPYAKHGSGGPGYGGPGGPGYGGPGYGGPGYRGGEYASCNCGDCGPPGCHGDACCPIPDCYTNHQAVAEQLGGPAGPPAPTVTYPYYTTRGPRDFLAAHPTPIGP